MARPRALVRYHGGKVALGPWIASLMPPHSTYVEPYGGGFGVGIQKAPAKNEIYNELDGLMVNLFRVLRDPVQSAELRRLLELTPYSREEWEACKNPSDDPVESARRVLVRSFQGYGAYLSMRQHTSFRLGVRGEDVSAAREWRTWPEWIPFFTDRLRGVVIERRPALSVIKQYDSPKTLIYVDPPYVHSTRGTEAGKLKHAYPFEMTDDDHRELATALHKVKGFVILSGYPSPLYEELFEEQGWKVVSKPTHADGAHDRTECVWLNPRCAACQFLNFEEVA